MKTAFCGVLVYFVLFGALKPYFKCCFKKHYTKLSTLTQNTILILCWPRLKKIICYDLLSVLECLMHLGSFHFRWSWRRTSVLVTCFCNEDLCNTGTWDRKLSYLLVVITIGFQILLSTLFWGLRWISMTQICLWVLNFIIFSNFSYVASDIFVMK